MNRSTPGLPVHNQLPELAQTHVQRVSDAIQSSHPLPSARVQLQQPGIQPEEMDSVSDDDVASDS